MQHNSYDRDYADYGIALQYRIPDEMWAEIEPRLVGKCPPKPKKKQGRPRMSDRQAMNAIFNLLRTGCQWNALPRSLGAHSTVHDRFQQWREAGVFAELWREGLLQYNEQKGIEWEWQAMDGAMTKAPLGKKDGSNEAIEAGTGPNPTDRGKSGTKRSLLTDGRGIPLAVAVAGANRNDCKMVEQTLSSIMVDRPEPTLQCPQHLCMDAGYDGDPVYQLLWEWDYIPHIRSRYDERIQLERVPRYRARRWVVERTHSWLNRFRRLLIRWEKKVENYTAMMHLACAFICFRAGELFG